MTDNHPDLVNLRTKVIREGRALTRNNRYLQDKIDSQSYGKVNTHEIKLMRRRAFEMNCQAILEARVEQERLRKKRAEERRQGFIQNKPWKCECGKNKSYKYTHCYSCFAKLHPEKIPVKDPSYGSKN